MELKKILEFICNTVAEFSLMTGLTYYARTWFCKCHIAKLFT